MPRAKPRIAKQALWGQALQYTNGIPSNFTAGTNVAAYLSWGWNGGLGGSFPTNGVVDFTGISGWYLIETEESFNGWRNGGGFQCSFLEWFASGAFGGTNYADTPCAAVSNVDEPGMDQNDPTVYFPLWASERCFALCAWNSINSARSPQVQEIGDPFIRK
jgi:hypothetical protein